MSPQEFRELLLKWRTWFFSDHRLRGLGYAKGGYAERVGRAFTTADPADDIDVDVGLWHDYFRLELPDEIRKAIQIEYLQPGQRKAKYDLAGVKERDYVPRLEFAIDTACGMFNRWRESRRESAGNAAPITADDSA